MYNNYTAYGQMQDHDRSCYYAWDTNVDCAPFLTHKPLSSVPPQILVDQNIKASPHIPRWDLLEPIFWMAFDSPPCQPWHGPACHTARNCACHWRWRFGPPGSRILEDKPGNGIAIPTFKEWTSDEMSFMKPVTSTVERDGFRCIQSS